MRLMILAYNPSHVKAEAIHTLCNLISKSFGVTVFNIEHFDNNEEPIYCVQFVDTK